MKLDSVSVSFFFLFGIMGFYMKSNSTSRNVKWDNLYQFSHQDNKKVYMQVYIPYVPQKISIKVVLAVLLIIAKY